MKRILDYKFTFNIKHLYIFNKKKEVTEYTLDNGFYKSHPYKKKVKINFNVIKISLIIGGVIMALNGVENWGWLIFIALFMD